MVILFPAIQPVAPDRANHKHRAKVPVVLYRSVWSKTK